MINIEIVNFAGFVWERRSIHSHHNRRRAERRCLGSRENCVITKGIIFHIYFFHYYY